MYVAGRGVGVETARPKTSPHRLLGPLPSGLRPSPGMTGGAGGVALALIAADPHMSGGWVI